MFSTQCFIVFRYIFITSILNHIYCNLKHFFRKISFAWFCELYPGSSNFSNNKHLSLYTQSQGHWTASWIVGVIKLLHLATHICFTAIGFNWADKSRGLNLLIWSLWDRKPAMQRVDSNFIFAVSFYHNDF